jgi:hypothetical protein
MAIESVHFGVLPELMKVKQPHMSRLSIKYTMAKVRFRRFVAYQKNYQHKIVTQHTPSSQLPSRTHCMWDGVHVSK